MSTSVAIQGIKGCFHEMAARKYFAEELELIECYSFKSLCQSLENGNSDYAVMAIENTLAGSLLSNYSLIQKFGFKVVGEVFLHIKMNLLVIPGTPLSDIREIYSHPVALAQCENYLEKLENIELIEYHDTAAAARMVGERNSSKLAAVGNDLSSELYGLEILEEGIETHKKNYTRFLVLSREANSNPHANKASVTLIVSHEPGSLADVLMVFKNYQVNLTKIQSTPIIGKPYQYAFKIDLTWQDYAHYTKAVQEVQDLGSEIEVMGEYLSANYEI